MGDSATGLGVAINRCGQFAKVRIDAAPGIAACEIFTGGQGWTCAKGIATGPATDTADVNVTLTGPANCARPVTIALYRPDGEVAELRGPIARCRTGGEPGKPACSNGIDDDGDGMIDDHFADGATDPDPGCTSTTDTTESSELAAPAGCEIQLGLWDDTELFAGARTHGCGAIQGFWYHAPAAVLECGYWLGDADLERCQTFGETGGTMFTATTQDLDIAVKLAAKADCRPMTLALIRADNSVIGFRAKLAGC